MLHRNALKALQKWKISTNRKPLLIRGARQVGKTTLVHILAKEYINYIELNLERTLDLKLFETDDIDQILKGAFLLKKVTPKKGDTLLFIDEIQESPKAIKLLRYFYEEKPDIHVVAAGSLLEFALDKVPGFPVGRIDYLYLHPLNFEEFLLAIDHQQAFEALGQVPVPPYAHNVLLKLFHDYALIGGMPEIVADYVKTNHVAGLQKTYNKLWTSYKDDVVKYAKNNTEKTIIRHVINTAPHEKDRIKFERFGNSNYRSREVGDALKALDLARIIRLVYPTTSLQPPIITDYKKRPRLQFLDTGLLNQILLLQGELIGINDLSDFYKGRIIQHLVGQELYSIHTEGDYQLHFWVRESKDSNSEVDLVYRHGKYVIPIEVKSGKQGRLRSLHQFIERTDHRFAVRLHANTFSIETYETPVARKKYQLMNLPYYLGTKLPDYIRYFAEEDVSLSTVKPLF